jgi:uncharacterized RDD family membrane protein YckC
MSIEELDIIETPENVDLQRRLAGIGSRFLAGLLDSLLIAAMLLVPTIIFLLLDLRHFFLGDSAAEEVEAWIVAMLSVAGFLIYWGYFLFFELWMNGQTPGKKYMRIRVVQQEGRAVSFNSIAVRNLLRAVDAFGVYAVAGIVMFATRKMQRLGDLAAGTVVVSEDIPDYSARQDKKERVLDDMPATAAVLDETHLTPQEYRLLHSYWLRREQLTLEARYALLPKLLRPVLERMGTLPADNSLATLEKCLEEVMSQGRTVRPNDPSPEPPEVSP